MGLLAGRVAIVTGASKGIGRVNSQVFAAQGARVICGARTAHLVEETVARIQDDGGEAIAVTCDVARAEDARRLVTTAVEREGRLDCLGNNAGDSGPTRPVQEYSLEDWHYTVDSCLTSAFLCAKFAVQPMIAAGGGVIVNIASM